MLYQNKYRIESTRLQGYDYQSPGMYFVTICSDEKKHIFGDIKNGIVCLNDIGTIAYQCWVDIPKHFPNVSLDVFVIMPNHMHGIVVIESNDDAVDTVDNNVVHCRRHRRHGRDVACNVSTSQTSQLNINDSNFFQSISPKPGSLSTIIRSYKSSVTHICRKRGIGHVIWQRSFHDRIIRNEKDLKRIRQYILQNPVQWKNE